MAATSSSERTAPAKNRLQRLIDIYDTLRGAGDEKVTLTQLSKDLRVNSRTIRRDIKLLKEMLGVAIESGRRGYCLDKDSESSVPSILEPLQLSPEETTALNVSHWLLMNGGAASGLESAIESAMKKVRQAMRKRSIDGTYEIKDIIHAPHNQPVRSATGGADHKSALPEVVRATRLKRELKITYRKPGTSRAEERVVEPLLLGLIEGRLNLLSWDKNRRAVRGFLVSRIEKATMLTTRFEPHNDLAPIKYFDSGFGSFTGSGEKEHDVMIGFDSEIAPYVVEEFWHGTQKFSQDRTGLTLRMKLSGTKGVVPRVLKWGRHAQILAPDFLKNEIAAEIASMHAMYSNTAAGHSTTPGAIDESDR